MVPQNNTVFLGATEQHFTGKERDSETGNDYIGARYYNSATGRFLSPDSVVMSPELGNPQSWNKYSYTFNNPIAAVDPDGHWPFYIHNAIDQAVFGGVLSPGQISVIEQESYVMDFGDHGRQQDPSRANEHGMCQPGQGSDACWKGIATWVDTAFGNSQNSSGDASLQYFADALHTVQDLGSPEHVGPGGPKTWSGGTIEGIAHIFGESSPEEGWDGIGTSIRNSVNLFALAHPDVAKQQGGTDRWSENAINSFVDGYFSNKGSALSSMPHPGAEANKEEGARQCALGNKAACDN
jgi:RHS repeat-associated protein